MKGFFQFSLLLFTVVASSAVPTTPKSKSALIASLNKDVSLKNKLLSKKADSCPRDCICTPSSRSMLARCNRLELGTQKFGDEFSDLIIENSKIPITLSDGIFKKLGLAHVINVKITQSTITSISPTAFSGLDDLYSVNLTANNIQKIDPVTFSTNNVLYLLSLSGNPLKMSSRFLKSTSLQELDISGCDLMDVPKQAFDDLTSLMYINLARNKLENLDSALFMNLDSLEEINLSNNNIKTLPKDLFAYNKEISSLYLDNNPLTSISGLQISELLAFSLKNTSIKVLKNGTFAGMMYLSNLNLNGNGIEVIEAAAFDNLTDLNYLDLSNNKIQHVPDTLIINSGYLDVFKIANNTQLRQLPAEGFLVDNYDFNIYLFDASGCSIEIISNNTFKNMPSLSQVNLSRNRITSVGSAFDNLGALVDLDISHNMIEILDKKTFVNNKDLAKLNLAGNPLVLISLDLFTSNPSLKWLDISSCQLYKMWESTENMPKSTLENLQYLYASNNQFSNVNFEELQNFKKLETLDISKNPLQCNVIFERLMKWLGENNVSPFSREAVISNMDAEEKQVANKLNWEILAKDICGSKPESAIIEKTEIAKDSDILNKIKKNPIKDKNGDYIVDDDDNDDDDDEEDDEDDDDDEEADNEDVNNENDETKEDDYYDEDEGLEDLEYSSEESTKKSEKKTTKPSSDKNHTSILLPVKVPEEKSEITETLFENHNDLDIIREKEEILKTSEENPANNKISDFDYEVGVKVFRFNENEGQDNESISEITSWTMDDSQTKLLFASTALVVFVLALFILLRAYRHRMRMQNRSNIFVVTTTTSRVKRDCGLVYQQLTEDLTGPKTPILNKHHLISNMTAETNPFQNTKVAPEDV